ncbi:NAD(P)-binding protein [Athelia psychrophila]|uniref:NAD(P)-binding protein n=1 Tax=Athelia psychrophila TaxID=1759441 RepID=A0A166HJZ8_9AGAM|nr:NAD(P)-binding protein [Fibularhizoctonia sp. CBS 109695]
MNATTLASGVPVYTIATLLLTASFASALFFWLRVFPASGTHASDDAGFFLQALRLSLRTTSPSPLAFWKSHALQGFPPASAFSVDDVPDLSGKVVMVTGGNRGVGFETAKALLSRNAKVYIASRSADAATTAIAQLKEMTGREAFFIKLDLTSPRSVKAAAEEFLSKEAELHILYNNAGVLGPPLAQITADNYDHSWVTNVMGPYFLTTLLMPALLAGAKSSADGKARIVTISSVIHQLGRIDFDTLLDGPARIKLGQAGLYIQSKHANIVFSKELARRYGDRGIVSTAVNPGNLDTDLMRYLGRIDKMLLSSALHPAAFGALTPLYAGASAGSAQFNGKYFIPWAREGTPQPDTQDEIVGQKLWAWLEKHTQARVAFEKV